MNAISRSKLFCQALRKGSGTVFRGSKRTRRPIPPQTGRSPSEYERSPTNLVIRLGTQQPIDDVLGERERSDDVSIKRLQDFFLRSLQKRLPDRMANVEERGSQGVL